MSACDSVSLFVLDLTIVHFRYCILVYFYSVSPEDRPRIAAPVVAVTIDNASHLADSLVNNPIRIEFNIRQVCH